jgi:hypothetical protein
MKEEIAALLKKAHRKLDAGRNSLAGGFPEEAASDAYYAMYHAAKAALLTRAPRVKGHGDVSRKFEQVLADRGLVNPKYKQYLEHGLRERHLADYETDLTATTTNEDAEHLLNEATEFVVMIEDFLKSRTK